MAAKHWLVTVAEKAGLGGEHIASIAGSSSSGEVWAALRSSGKVGDAELARLVAAYFRLNVANFDDRDPNAVRLVPEAVARKHQVFPLREDDSRLIVATFDPMNMTAEQELGFASGRTPVFVIASPSVIADAIDARFSPNRVIENLLVDAGTSIDEDVRLVASSDAGTVEVDDIESEPVVKLTNLILRDAIACRASDIHIEPGAGGGTVRYRVDGMLRRHMQLPGPAFTRVVSRVKIFADLDIADRLRPQDGRARVQVAGKSYDLRISTVPAHESEKVVIRILNPGDTTRLGDIGFTAVELGRLRHVLGYRSGIILVTGPTGSGKTTTLYAALRELATDQINIMTVEDPVEYKLAGITQIQIEPRRGVTFASSLRAILRQDPDVILVGEIRDLETAEVAVQAAMTGHLVLATLHTNDAVSAVQRLLDLGLDRPSISGAVRAAVAQRLVRRACTHCGRPDGEEPPGCDACEGTGYFGRAPIMEVMIVNEEIERLIGEGAGHGELERAAIHGGMRALRPVAEEMVRSGTTSRAEVERVLGQTTDQPPGAPPPGPAGPAVPKVPAADDTPHVLLVDDDSVSRRLARSLLESAGYVTSEASNGVIALEMLNSGEEFSLMVLDLEMPRLDGRAVLSRVRESDANIGLPVLVLTGSVDAEAEAQLMDAGADDYIRKPLDPARFLARVRAALRRAGHSVAETGR